MTSANAKATLEITASLLLALAMNAGCDQLPVAPKVDAGPVAVVEPPPKKFEISTSGWSSDGAGALYEIRDLPDGKPGLFSAEGQLLLELMPKLIVDVSPTGEKRRKPLTLDFEMLRLSAHEGGGFALFGKVKDPDGHSYELFVDNGPGDPRVHVAVNTKWKKDVDVLRHTFVFRTGDVGAAFALGPDYARQEVADEFIEAAQTPEIAWFGSGSARFTAVGRFGVEGMTIRKTEDARWDIELDVYHHENHPLGPGPGCKERLDGMARVPSGTKFEVRADFVLGSTRLPIVHRNPRGIPAAIALADSGANVPFLSDGQLVPARERGTLTEDLEKAACDGGRFEALAKRQTNALLTAADIQQANGLDGARGAEADPRGVAFFRHAAARVDADTPMNLFRATPIDPQWLAANISEASLAALRDRHGVFVGVVPDLAAALAAESQSGPTVGALLREAAKQQQVWLGGPGALARHTNAVEDLEFDFMPEGRIRIRNPELVDIQELTLILPPGATARYVEGDDARSEGSLTWFDLGGRREKLVQLFEGENPMWTMHPALVSVKYSKASGKEPPAPPNGSDQAN